MLPGTKHDERLVSSGRAIVCLLAASLGFSVGCWATEVADAPPGAPIVFVLDETRFPTTSFGRRSPAFDLLATDMDLDGDPDLLVNRHHQFPLELYENVEGKLTLLNPGGAERDPTGLLDNPGLESFFASTAAMAPLLGDRGAGIYVWHDVNRNGWWHLWSEPVAAGVKLEIAFNSPVEMIDVNRPYTVETYGLPSTLKGQKTLSVDLGPGDKPHHLRFRIQHISHRFEITARNPTGDDAPLTYWGRSLTRRSLRESVAVWLPDPHGMAWVDVRGSHHPDLLITRGGLAGTLRPPEKPKIDRFYAYSGGATLYEHTAEGVLHPSYGRGRSLAWVDVDADGTAELYIGNTGGANTLSFWQKDPQGRVSLMDRARKLSVNFGEGDSFVWLDLDGDGFDDLVLGNGEELSIARNPGRSAGAFKTMTGAELGLSLPEAKEGEHRGEKRSEVFTRTALHCVDVDADGRMDLWVTGRGGAGRPNVLFLRRGDTFEDHTKAFGLAAIGNTRQLLLADFDADGLIDAVSLGSENVILHNRSGRGFSKSQLELGTPGKEQPMAAVADIDGDGRRDLLVISRAHRVVAMNRTPAANRVLRLDRRPGSRPPIGTEVRAEYSDGHVTLQRYGSADNTNYSQALGPLYIARPDQETTGRSLDSISIRPRGGEFQPLADPGSTGALQVLGYVD